MGSPRARARPEFTWCSVVAALFVVVFLPPSPDHVAGWARVVFAPAAWFLDMVPSIHVSSFPLLAAAELLIAGMAVDAARWLSRRLAALRRHGLDRGAQ